MDRADVFWYASSNFCVSPSFALNCLNPLREYPFSLGAPPPRPEKLFFFLVKALRVVFARKPGPALLRFAQRFGLLVFVEHLIGLPQLAEVPAFAAEGRSLALLSALARVAFELRARVFAVEVFAAVPFNAELWSAHP